MRRSFGVSVGVGRTITTFWFWPLDYEWWTNLSMPRSYGFGIWIVREFR